MTAAQAQAAMVRNDAGYRSYVAARTAAHTAKTAKARKAAAAEQEANRAAYTAWNKAARVRRQLLAVSPLAAKAAARGAA
jgi:hypothetical protein